MSGPRVWSVSAALSFEECRARFKRQYVDREPRPATEIPLHWRRGTVVHAALEAAWKHRLATRGHGPMWTDENWAVAKEALAESWAKEEMPAPAASDGIWDQVHLDVETTLKAQSTAWEDIVGVEHKFFVRAGMNIIGFADLLLKPEESTLLIRDWKVRKAASDPADLRRNFQLLLYGAMAKRTMAWVRHVQASHFNPPTGVEVVVDLDDGDIAAAIPRLQAVRDMAAAETEWAPEKGAWCDSCGYRSSCPAWASENTPSVAQVNLDLF